MADAEQKIDANFFQLVVSLQMAAMQQMGKITSPVSGKVEKNLDQARASIDIISMLAEKTDGNLTLEEKDLIDRILFELRMNFVDETNKAESEPAGGETEDKGEGKEEKEGEEGEKAESSDSPEDDKEKKDGD